MKELFLPSGRGVRYEVLDADEVERIDAAAAAEISEGTTAVEYTRTVSNIGVRAMLRAVTTVNGLLEEKAQEEATWRPTTAQELDLDDKFKALFSSRDAAMLRAIYQRHHIVTEEDVKRIMGKEREVS